MTGSDDAELDRTIRDAGEQWRSGRPAPRAVDFPALLAGSAPRRSRVPRLLLTASGAGLAAVLAVVGFVLADSNNKPPMTPQVHSSTAGVQPWEPLPPGPSPAPSPSPSPSVPVSSLRLCSSADLQISEVDAGAGAGTGYGIVLLRNTSASACQLPGVPKLSDGGGTPITLSFDQAEAMYVSAAPAFLQPEQVGGFSIAVPDAGCPTAEPNPTHLSLRLPGGGTLPFPTLYEKDCPNGIGQYFLARHTADKINPWTAVELPTPSPTPPAGIDALTATMQGSGSATAGKTYDYTVTLHNPTDQPVTLSPCPTYDERTKTRYDQPAERYTLNCAGASIVPAGGDLTFAMRYEVAGNPPIGGQDSLIWWLDAHDVTAVAPLNVADGG